MKFQAITVVFLMSVVFAFFPFDIAHVGLAVASVIGIYWATLNIEKKRWQLLFFVPVSILMMQLSVWMRDCAWSGGLQQFFQKSIGSIVGDFLYGCKYTIIAFIDIAVGSYQALANNDYTLIESLNYRFIITAILIVCFGFRLLTKKKTP